MKKVKSRKRGSAAKGSGGRKKTASGKRIARKRPGPAKKRAPKNSALKTAAPTTVDQYLAAVPEPARSALQQIREAIRSVVPPEATEIISYKIPAFKHKKVLVWYAAFANHCSLFPTASVIEAFKDELKSFSTSKGTLHFSLDKPMPVELIKRLVKARVAESESAGKKR
jgi:uncharacterized protein YdhG (YjbR/CyaY superfamily)